MIASALENAFLFPLLVRYNPPLGRVRGFVEAGATLEYRGAYSGRALVYQGTPTPLQIPYSLGAQPLYVAVTTGVGLRLRVGMVDLVPEVRIDHWTAVYDQPAQNEVMIALTVGLRRRIQ